MIYLFLLTVAVVTTHSNTTAQDQRKKSARAQQKTPTASSSMPGLAFAVPAALLVAAALAVTPPADMLGDPTVEIGSFWGDLDGAKGTALFKRPYGLAIDPVTDDIVVADHDSSKIRRVNVVGDVSTFAGTGSNGNMNGAGNVAKFNRPTDVAVDAKGVTFVADYYAHTVRKVDATGWTTVLTGKGTAGYVDAIGEDAWFKYPNAVELMQYNTNHATLYIADRQNHAVRQITIATWSNNETTSWVGQNSNQWCGNADGPRGTGRLCGPSGIAAHLPTRNIYICDLWNHVIRKADRYGVLTTIAGAGVAGFVDGSATEAYFHYPHCIAMGPDGTLFVTDYTNMAVRQMRDTGAATRTVETIMKGDYAHSLLGIVVNQTDGSIYVAGMEHIVNRRWAVTGYRGATRPHVAPPPPSLPALQTLTLDVGSGGGGGAGFADGPASSARFSSPYGIAIDPTSGFVVLGDFGNHRIRSIDLSGVVSTLAGTGEMGRLDGPAATSKFKLPAGVTVSAAGVAFVAEEFNNVVRMISAGTVSTFAGSGGDGYHEDVGPAAHFSRPSNVHAMGDTILVADRGNHRVRMVGLVNVTTRNFAGHGAAGFRNGYWGELNRPHGLAFFGAVVFVADIGNHAIRKVTMDGILSTFVGGNDAGFVDGTYDKAKFSSPHGLAADSNGYLLVADMRNGAVRQVDLIGSVVTLATMNKPFMVGIAVNGSAVYNTGDNSMGGYGA
jgi:hypothetical protein